MVFGEYKIDLHVHTPASSDYKGLKTDDEYKGILKQAKENGISLICITDHNTVAGYKKFMELKKQTFDLLCTLRKRNDSMEYQNIIEEEWQLFNSLHILMGVELCIHPGVHFIIVFQENVEISRVEKFILDLTKEPKVIVSGSANLVLDINFKLFFETVLTYFEEKECFIYAPHCDSSSGVIEAFKNFGDQRQKILQDDRLICLGFNKEDTKKYVMNSLMPHFQKKRSRQLHFIQDSDFHGRPGEKVGLLHFTIDKKLGNIGFDLLIKRFESNKMIRTSLDTALEDYEEFKKENFDNDLFIFENILEKKEEERLCKTLCALINSDKGGLEIHLEIKERSDTKEEVENILKYISDLLKVQLNYDFGIISYTQFQVSKSKQIFVMSLKDTNRLCLYNGVCYILDFSNNIQIANSTDIESIVSRKIYQKYGKRKEKLINSITMNSANIKNNLISFSNAYKVENYIIPYSEFDIKFVKSQKLPKQIKDLQDQVDENYNGNYVILHSIKDDIIAGRYSDSYFRISPPTFKINENIFNDGLDINTVEGNSIILIPGGGVLYISENKKLVSEIPCVIITPYEETIPLSTLIAFLKSSFLTWYFAKIKNYYEIIDFIIANKKKLIPVIKQIYKKDDSQLLGRHIQNILDFEKEFLKNISKMPKRTDEEKYKYIKYIENHNSTCDEQLRIIDKKIFNLIGFQKRNASELYKDLKELNIYDYKGLECLNKMYD